MLHFTYCLNLIKPALFKNGRCLDLNIVSIEVFYETDSAKHRYYPVDLVLATDAIPINRCKYKQVKGKKTMCCFGKLIRSKKSITSS